MCNPLFICIPVAARAHAREKKLIYYLSVCGVVCVCVCVKKGGWKEGGGAERDKQREFMRGGCRGRDYERRMPG